ncbi:MAG: ABC transporter ATP-binding protein [Lachnospiraceae bacterium]|nr:ABC transporter ATP-binding protein [Lachnospiraceae bacterium]
MLNRLNYIFSHRDKLRLLLLMVMMIIGSVLELMGVSIFMPFINIIMEPGQIQENPYLLFFYKLGGFTTVEGFLGVIAGVIICIYLVKNVFLAVMQNSIIKFCYNTQKRISTRLLKTYMSEPYSFHLNKNVAELQRSMQEDTTQFSQFLIHTLEVVAELAVCAIIGIYLYVVSQSITAIVLGLLVLCVGGFTFITKKYSKKIGRDNQYYRAKLFQWVNQSLGGIKEIKVLEREEFFTTSYEAFYSRFARGLKNNRLLSAMPKYVVETVCMTGLLLAVLVKMFFGQKDIVDFIPQLAVFAVAAFRLLPSVGRINDHVNNILYATPSVELIYHDLKNIEEFEAESRENPQEKEVLSDWKLEKEIAVKHVTYSYPNMEKPVLEDVSCVIPKGSTAAFIGPSGAGKTTLIDIILGLLPPQMGKIYADDLNVYKNISTWHRQIGYIPQTIYLSDDTIRNNIAFGVREDEIDDEALYRAAEKAQLAEFIDSLPEGMDTFVGDRGIRLSGGQRQRIGIARALYHDPEVLVLDEATSALDSDTESAVMESVEKLQGTKTMLIIAHRLTTIQNADVIYEVSEGKVRRKQKEDIFSDGR